MMNLTTMQQPPLKQKLLQLQQDLAASASASPLSTMSANGGMAGDPYERMMRQGMLLEGVKRTKEQLQNDIALGTPKPYRSRALALYNQIASTTHFNEKGELVVGDRSTKDASGARRAIEGSRAEDLIQHAVRDRRKQFTPTGWSEFLTELHSQNVPRMMLNRQTIDELQTISKPPPPSPPRHFHFPFQSFTVGLFAFFQVVS